MLMLHIICFTVIDKKEAKGHNFYFILNRSKSADAESRYSPVQSKGPVTALHESDHTLDKTSGCFSDLSRTCSHFWSSN